MSENLKTIRELADEFKVSKQAVRKRLTDENNLIKQRRNCI